MTRRPPPDPALDAQLSALRDGALDAKSAAKLRADPVAAARLAEFERGDALVADIFADELAAPPSQALLDLLAPAPGAAAPAPAHAAQPAPTPPPVPRPAPPRRRPVRAAVALALAAGLGALAVLGVQTLQTRGDVPGWIAQVADYHRVYSAEERHLVEVPAAEAEHIVTWLSQRVGAFAIPDFSAAGLEFRGARLLAAAGRPVAQLVYTNAAGDVVALCITPRPGAPDAAPSVRRLGDLTSVDWRADGQAFIVVGPETGPPLPPLATQVRDAI